MRQPAPLSTRADLDGLPAGTKGEIIDGVLYAMTRPRTTHLIPEMFQDPRVVEWLVSAGLTKEELAIVQPSYCSPTPADCVCQGVGAPADGGPANVVVEVERILSTTGRVAAVHGGPDPASAAVGEEVLFQVEGVVGSRSMQVARPGRALSDGGRTIYGFDGLALNGESIVPCAS